MLVFVSFVAVKFCILLYEFISFELLLLFVLLEFDELLPLLLFKLELFLFADVSLLLKFVVAFVVIFGVV